jgi:hypothetical protein
MKKLEYLLQSIEAYRKRKDEYLSVFNVDFVKARELARQIEIALDPISDALKENFIIPIENRKASRELENIKEGRDSLFKFYDGLYNKILDEIYKDFTEEIEYLLSQIENSAPLTEEETEEYSDISYDLEEYNWHLDSLYEKLHSKFGEKIIDIRILSVKTEPEAIVAEAEKYCDFWGIPERRHQINTLIIRKNEQHGSLDKYLDIVGTSYILGQYLAVIVFSQALLEELFQIKFGSHRLKIKLGLLIEKEYLREIDYSLLESDLAKIKKINDLANAIKHNLLEKELTEVKSFSKEALFTLKLTKELLNKYFV